MPKQFTKEQIIKILQDKSKSMGRTPEKDYWIGPPSKTTIQNYFGSWNRALIAAGLEPNIHTKTTREEVIEDIKRFAKELGRPPKRAEYVKFGKYTKVDNFGGWNSLIDEISFRRMMDVTKQNLIDSLVDVANAIGRSPHYVEYCNHPLGYSREIVYKFYKSYDDLLRDAELSIPYRNGGWLFKSEEWLLSQVRQVAGDLGYTPSAVEFSRLSETHANTVRYRFGTYNKFVKLAGLKTNGSFSANDGHVVHSRFELSVDNFLFSSKIQHLVQVRVCPKRLWTCDFVVGDAWVECDGYCGQKRPYNGSERQQEKYDYYHKHSYNLITVFPNQDWKLALSRL